MPILHQDIIVKQPQWAETVEAVLAKGTVRGVPTPPDLPPGGYLGFANKGRRTQVTYRTKGREIQLGSATEAGRQELRQRYLAKHPITLENGCEAFVIFDWFDPDLARPVPVAAYRLALACEIPRPKT